MENISIITELENGEYVAKKVVFFYEDKAPVIEDCDNNTLFKLCEILKNYEGGFKKAEEDNVLKVYLSNDEKNMSKLNSRILEEQAKYSAEEAEEREEQNNVSEIRNSISEVAARIDEQRRLEEVFGQLAEEKPVEKTSIELPKEIRELAQYFRFEKLRNKGALTEDEVIEMDRIIRENSYASDLEKARKYAINSNDKSAKKGYQDLHDHYRAELAKAIYDLNNPNRNLTTELTNEYKELKDYFKKNILRNNHQLPQSGIDYINKLASTNSMIAELEDAKSKMENKIISQEEYDEVYNKYSIQLANEEAAINENIKKLRLYNERNVQNTRENTEGPVLPSNVEQTRENTEDTVSSDAEQTKESAEETVAPSIVDSENTEDTVSNDAEQTSENTERPVLPSVVDPGRENTEEPVSSDAEQTSENTERPVLPSVVEPGRENTEEQVPSDTEQTKESTEGPVLPSIVDPENTEEQVPSDTEQTKESAEEPVPRVVPNEPPKVDDNHRTESISRQPLNENTGDNNGGNEVDNENREPAIIVSSPENVTGEGVRTAANNNVENTTVPVNGKKVTVRKTSKLKAFFQRIGTTILSVIIAVGGAIGLTKLFNKNNKNKTPVTPSPTNNTHFVTPAPTNYNNNLNRNNTNTNTNANTNSNNNDQMQLVNQVVDQYAATVGMPSYTRAFIQTPEVMSFLSQYTKPDQIEEVVSAIAFGFETNMLTRYQDNFRMNEDGSSYLTAFTNDFLCAKVVVNGYSPAKCLAVFGDSDITYEQVMDGYRNFYNMVFEYYTTATIPLPFKYLTGNNTKNTNALNELSERIIEVNINRKNGTLTNVETDKFIATADKIFAQNDGSLSMTEGAKGLGSSIVRSFTMMQAQISNGEPLYLHEDYGVSKAGINLKEADGRYSDKDKYEYTSLYDIIDQRYGLGEEGCFTVRAALNDNLESMHNLSNTDVKEQRIALAEILYQNGLTKYANRVINNDIDDALLTQIEIENPLLSNEIAEYKYAASNSDKSEYVPFAVTVSGVDTLLRINGEKENDYTTLTNIRRDSVSQSKNYKVVTGRRYTGQINTNTNNKPVATPTPVVVETHEKVKYEELTQEEQKEVDAKVEEMETEEKARLEEEEEKIEKGHEVLTEQAQEGATQEQLEEIGEEYGIDVDPDYAKNTQEALAEQAAGEEKKAQMEAEIAERNRQAEEEAAKRAAEEKAAQDAAREEEERLIRESMMLEQGEPSNETPLPEANTEPNYDEPVQVIPDDYDPQLDPNRIDIDAGEEPYTGSLKDDLSSLRAAALSMDVNVNDLSLEKSLKL